MRKLLVFSVVGILSCYPLVTVAASAQDISRDIKGKNWNAKKVGHLLRRAGFSGTPAEINEFVQLGSKKASVKRLVDYSAPDYDNPDSVASDPFEQLVANQRFDLNFDPNNPGNLKDLHRWWFFRMMATTRPLEEKMTLFWHTYFPVSHAKIGNMLFIKNQNMLFRKYALGSFRDMLHGISKDPATLIWLENNLNTRQSNSEMFARHLLEIYTLGEGNFSEADVVAATKAFTGWTVRSNAFFFNAGAHDNTLKTFLGETANFNGNDIIDRLLVQPATARYLATRLITFFAYEDPEPEFVERVAGVYFASNYSIKEMVREIFLSKEFYSDRAIRNAVKSPVELVIGTLRLLGAGTDLRAINGWTTQMGQWIYYAPDVKGWEQGRGWINTTATLYRYNFANTLITNRGTTGTFIRPDVILRDNGLQTAEGIVDYMLNLLVQNDVSADTRESLIKYMLTRDDGTVGTSFTTDATTIDKKVRGLIYIILASPEYQLN